MNWLFGDKYKVWVVSTDEEVELFLWDNFKIILPNLNSIIELTDKKKFIRSFQSYEFENKWLGFGRMKWNAENNKKWATKYRSEKSKNKKVKFFSTEIWSPDWNECNNKGKFPELFINIYHNENIKFSREGVLIAMKKKIAAKNIEAIESNIVQLSKRIRNSKIAAIERKWRSGKGFVNKIAEMNPHELEKIIKRSMNNTPY